MLGAMVPDAHSVGLGNDDHAIHQSGAITLYGSPAESNR